MIKNLTSAIVIHILKNLGCWNSQPDNSIINDQFLLSSRLLLEDNEEVFVYSCQTQINNTKLKIICCKPEDIFILVKLDGCPAYGCHYYVGEGFIDYKLEDKNWIPTTTYIQATFLAGMEQLKDLTSSYEKMDDENIFEDLKKYISYRNLIEEE